MAKKNRIEKRKLLCEVATALFVENGFEKTTIRDIAKAAGMNSSAIYYYFEDKESLLFQMLNEIMDASLGQMKKIAQSNIDINEKIKAIIQVHTVTFCSDPIKMALIVHNQKSLSTEHWEIMKGKHREYFKVVSKVLNEMKKDNIIANLNSTACTFALFGMIQWGHRWYDPNGPIKINQLIEIFTHIFTRGIYSKDID